MKKARLAMAGIAISILCPGPSLRAGDAKTDEARRAAVAARVGSREITVGDIETRLAEMPRFQRQAWGATPAAVRQGLLGDVLVPQTLLELAAEARGLASQPPTSYAIERARSGATIRAIRARIGGAGTISAEEVRGYYDQNRANFEYASRYQVWRILCKTRDEAQATLDAIKRDPTPKAFSEFARERSLDKATYLRGGDLGFVTADGLSSEPGLRVDPAIMRAVLSVHDGDIVSSVVAEGEYYATIWRRSSVPANHQTVDEVAPAIRDRLWRDRIRTETDQLLAGLRTAKVRALNEAILESADIPAEPVDGGARTR